MSKFDDDYISLVKEILNKGVEVENRTGVNSIAKSMLDKKMDIPLISELTGLSKNQIAMLM